MYCYVQYRSNNNVICLELQHVPRSWCFMEGHVLRHQPERVGEVSNKYPEAQ